MREPQLCISVTAATMDELRRRRDAAEGADLVEVRLDGVDRPDAAGALEGRRRPVIVTCRPIWEGGRYDGPEEARQRLLEQAAAAGAEFIDVEARAAFAPSLLRARRGRGIVVSAHTFGPMPADLGSRWAGLKALGAEVAKLAVEVATLSEALDVMTLATSHPAEPGALHSDHVLIAMGEPGVPSRVLAARMGNRWTYAGQGLAPGQIPPERLVSEFRLRDLQPDTAVYGVVGNPVSHSRSPAMHNAGFCRLGLDAVYLPLRAADAGDFVRFARRLPLAGASITAPFKVALMSAVDELDPLARRVGAVNTLVVREGRWFGANTDVYGFSAPLQRRMAVRGIRATILGAGGAARAVAVALGDLGAHVTVSARRPDAAREIASLAGGQVGEFPPRGGSWDVLVNAIPSDGGAGVQSPITGVPLDGEIVFDLVYTPAETRLLADARAAGCMTIGGLEMLVAQAERQFELWTGQPPPAGLFQQAAGQSLV